MGTDAVVLNPPRRGVARSVREGVARLGPAAVAYVSCEPETLARDLDHLARLGYRARRVEPFDLMPQTHEVESVVLLLRATAVAPVVLARHGDGWFLDKSPHEPMTRHPEHVTSLIDRARSSLGEAQLTPVQSLEEGTSGVCLVARTGDTAAAWGRAFASDACEQTYLVLVRGITREKGSVRRPLRTGGRSEVATTRFARIAVVSGHSFLRVTVATARPQQIRRHLSGLGHPVLGDERFGHAASNRHMAERYGLDRTFVHCESVRMKDPHDGTPIEVRAPVPGDLASVLARMGGTAHEL